MAPILRQAGFAANRLARIDDQQLLYKLPPEDIWGHDHIKLSPMELLDRLAALTPPPRRHRHTYAGVFAPNSRWRPLVAATAGPDPTLAIRLHTHKTLIQKILGHLGLPTEPPMTAPARSPPQVEMHFAQRHRNSDRTGDGDLAGDGNLFDQTHWPNCP